MPDARLDFIGTHIKKKTALLPMEISSISGLPKGRVGSEESAQLGAAEEFRTEGESTLAILG